MQTSPPVLASTHSGANLRAILIDRHMGSGFAPLRTAADVAAVEAVPLEQRLEPASTYAAIQMGAAWQPDAPAIQFLPHADPTEAAVVISHAQFLARVTQSANLFHQLGVGPTDVVSLLLPLVPQNFYALFGAEAAGIANPVNPLLEPHQLAEILQAAGTKVVVALGPTEGADIWQKVQKIKGQVPSLKAILVVGGDANHLSGNGNHLNGDGTHLNGEGNPATEGAQPNGIQVLAFDAAVAAQPANQLVSGRQIQRHDVAAYFHTGGTTGTPKLVRHTHQNQVYQAWVCNAMLQGGPGKPMLFGLPLYHVGGALTQGLQTFAAGGSVVVLSPSGWRNPNAVKNVWKLIERFKPAVFGGVPTVLAAANGIPVGDADCSSFHTISGGGSGIPVAVGQALSERFKVPVLEVYGMTETASVHTISYPDRPVRLGSVGHAVPYSKVRVVKLDANGNDAGDCAVDEIGVVAMAGPGVFTGYLNAIHNQNAFVAPGWVNSGDLGRLDAQGYLWITGRAKDLIIRGGHNIDPMPIEEALYQHPSVALAAVIGQPDARVGELPLAYVQLKPGIEKSDALAAELHAWVRERTPERAAIPVQVLLIDAIPLTGVGKVFKPQLRWLACESVFAQALEPLKGEFDGLTLNVAVGADGTHGTLATVTLGAVCAWALNERQKEGASARVQEIMSPFVIRHALVWA